MAITATFTADFKSFYDAVQQSTVKLKDFQSNAETVARSVDKVANAFSGRKLVQDAEIMTKAIAEIGGATALTAKEQAQVNAKLTEAIEKYKVLGQVAPKEMQDLEKATRGVNTETAKTSTGLKEIGGGLLKMASAIGIAFSVDALVGFVGTVFETAGKVQDMSEKLGISAEAVQRFSYAAEQAGGSIDDVGAAIFKMNQKLAEGDKSTVHALTDLNLKLSDLRQMSPEQAFTTIADAIGKIANPMERARLQMELLGKAGGALGAAIAAGLQTVGDEADIMANRTIQRLADAEDAWTKLRNKVVTVTGEIIGAALAAEDPLLRVNAAVLGAGAPQRGAQPGREVVQTSDRRSVIVGGRGPDVNLGAAPGSVQAGAAELERLARERDAAARKAEAAAAKQEAIDARVVAGLREYGRLLADNEKATTTHFAAVGQGLQRFIQLNRSAAEELPTVMRGWQEMGVGAVESGKKLQQAGAVFGQAMNQNAADAEALFDRLARLPTVAGEFNKLGMAVQQFGGIIGSNLIGQLGSTLTAFSKVQGSIGDLKGGFSAITSGGGLTSILGGFTSIVSGIGGIVSAAQSAIAIGKALFNVFRNDKGRQSVVEFAESMGGFDVLQKKLELLGEEGDRLWKKLTQQTDKGNKEQAARNIKEVQDALDAYEATQEDVIGTTEEQARATIETASEAERAMKALEPLLKANEDQWRAWGDVVNSQIDRVAEALRSLALPNLSGAALQPSASTSGGGGTAVINLDGRQIAEAVVPRIPGVVRRYGLA